MVSFLSICSGSSGNCYYLGTPDFGVLIDVGTCHRKIKAALEARGIGMDSIQLVLVTHDHFDHVRFLDTFIRRQPLPVLTGSRVKRALLSRPKYAGLLPYLRTLEPEQCLDWPPLRIQAFSLPHDASQTLGFYIEWEETRFTLITDAGSLPPEALAYAALADTLVLESNFDEEMLRKGAYPPELKDRILSPETGHLSNVQAARVVEEICSPRLKRLFLCHLSEHNNTPELARTTMERTLAALPGGGELQLCCLPRYTPSERYPLT